MTRRASGRAPTDFLTALARVRETIRETDAFPLTHVWSFRIADVLALVRAAEVVEGTPLRKGAEEMRAKCEGIAHVYAAQHAGDLVRVETADDIADDIAALKVGAERAPAVPVAIPGRARPAAEAAVSDALFGEPDKHGHVTRISDSSLYDEKCVLCGATDGFGDGRLDQNCPGARR